MTTGCGSGAIVVESLRKMVFWECNIYNVLFTEFVQRLRSSHWYIQYRTPSNAMPSNHPKIFTQLQSLPEVIRVEKPRQSLIQVYHIRLALVRIPHDDLRVLPITILFSIHTQPLIYLQLQTVLIID